MQWTSGKNDVTFESEGVTLKGNLFLPTDFDPARQYPIILVTGSWTTVKEQMANLYASRMAAEGIPALTFDFRHWGESGGAPRQYEYPPDKIQDILNAVTFAQTLPFVDAERIGGLGVCASSGYMAYAAGRDPRIKALTLLAPWLHDIEIMRSVYGGAEGVAWRISLADAAKAKYEAAGEEEYVPAASPTDARAGMNFPAEFIDYYLNPTRGAVPQWPNQFNIMSWRPWLEFDGTVAADGVRVPTLIVHGENAAIPEGARKFYARLTAPKEIYWMPGIQFDFYDQEPNVTKSARAAANHFKLTL
ncbi:MAG: alpha/beta hydrolase [Anaerolineae bacterium]|nr:alpha/beta hydrolase [Anaerolineae bacterium]